MNFKDFAPSVLRKLFSLSAAPGLPPGLLITHFQCFINGIQFYFTIIKSERMILTQIERLRSIV